MADIVLPIRGSGPGRRVRGGALPTAADVPRVRPSSDPGVRVPVAAFSATGRGLQAAGQGLTTAAIGMGRYAERQQKLRDFTAVNEALIAYDRESMEEWQRRQLEDDPSRPDFMEDVGRYARDLSTQTLSSLPDDVSETARIKLEADLSGKALALEDGAGRLHLQAMARRAETAWSTRLNTYAMQARQTPDFLGDIIAEARSNLEGLAGNMTAEQERAALLQTRRDLAQAAVSGHIAQGRFDDARSVLADEDFADVFDVKSRTALTGLVNREQEAAERARVSAIDRQEREIEKAEKELSQRLTKDGLALAVSGELAAQWVLERQDALELSDFKALLKAAEDADGATDAEDDHETVASLYEGIANGDDITQDALDAFRRGEIKRETMSTILSRNDAQQGRTRPDPGYERATGYLRNALKPSELNDNPEGRLAYANALDEFNNWYETADNPSANDAMEKSREVVSAYRLIPPEKTTFALPIRPWMSFQRHGAPQDQLQAIGEDEVRTFELFQNGEIDESEFNRRAADLQKWRTTVEPLAKREN